MNHLSNAVNLRSPLWCTCCTTEGKLNRASSAPSTSRLNTSGLLQDGLGPPGLLRSSAGETACSTASLPVISENGTAEGWQ